MAMKGRKLVGRHQDAAWSDLDEGSNALMLPTGLSDGVLRFLAGSVCVP